MSKKLESSQTGSPLAVARLRGPRQLVAVSAVTMLALTGCSGSGSGSENSSASSQETTSSSQPAMSQSSDAGAGAEASSSGSNSQGVSLEDAGDAALKEVADSTVISLETENNETQWEVQVVTSDGTEHEVNISAEDGSVMGSPSQEDDDAQDKKKHQKRVDAATVDFKEAAAKFRDAVPDARITELGLDDEQGTTVWEGDLIDGDGAKHEVQIDAGSGDVITNSKDADD
ncbi:PepSY domain-containing protein [Arthrobacter rhombi]|uniref:PepSY domain-containing protein n=1 Tax=Arthrobacter rhombi TaxID=71253 RepID=UPI003FD4D6B6